MSELTWWRCGGMAVGENVILCFFTEAGCRLDLGLAEKLNGTVKKETDAAGGQLRRRLTTIIICIPFSYYGDRRCFVAQWNHQSESA